MYREYGSSKRGEALDAIVSGRKFKRTGVVAALMDKDIIAPLQYNGTMDALLFETWFESCLLPSLPQKSIIVMDNATFHRKSKLIFLAENTEHVLIFLPPYSPNLNPIENFWSWLKRHLRKILPRYSSFNDALFSAFNVC